MNLEDWQTVDVREMRMLEGGPHHDTLEEALAEEGHFETDGELLHRPEPAVCEASETSDEEVVYVCCRQRPYAQKASSCAEAVVGAGVRLGCGHLTGLCAGHRRRFYDSQSAWESEDAERFPGKWTGAVH